MNYHLIAIGGAVMHNLAIVLHKSGHYVTGSDDEIYDPSLSRLKEYGLLPEKMGWDVERITTDIDIIILGKHAREDNPELKKALELGLDVKSFPEFIYEMSRDKRRVVVGGSHGKTTTTSMIMHACVNSGLNIDYLVGAQLEGFSTMVKLSDADIIIIEGDEYPSSAVDMKPKFLHYKPHLAVITGIAWDHINIFKEFEDYVAQFERFVESIEDGGTLYYYGDDDKLSQVVADTSSYLTAVPYKEIKHKSDKKGVSLIKSGGEEVPINIFGAYNMSNLAAAQMVCKELGISHDDFVERMRTFKGASKRQQVLGKEGGKIVYLDFAHAPSKVRATVKSMAERYGSDNIIACLELHTFSSLSKKFLPHYKDVFDSIGSAMVFYSPHTIEMKKLEPIEPRDVKEAFNFQDLRIGHEADDIEEFIKTFSEGKKTLLLMSSGKFGGLNLEEVTMDFIDSGQA